MEPDRDRYASSGRDVKRERDESADDHRASSSRHHVKRERDDDSGDSAVKREKKTDDFPVFRTTIVSVKSENGAEEASVKREPVARAKEERKGNPFIASLFMHELDMCSESSPVKREKEIKREKTGDVVKRELGSNGEPSADVKREQGAADGEGVVDPANAEKGVNVTEERATVVKEELGATVVKEERPAGSVKEEAAPVKAENGAAAAEEEYLKMDPTTGRLKVEKIDLSYSDW